MNYLPYIVQKQLSDFERDRLRMFHEYVIKETCNKYCLYYSNAYGGWDSFLINGNTVKQDKITSSSFVKGANSSNTLDFQKKKYLKK